MSEADLLYHTILVREQLDEAIVQLITLTLGLFVGVYYFLHRAGLWMKIGVFILYLFGWYVFVGSGVVTAMHWQGIGADLRLLIESGEASNSTIVLTDALRSQEFNVYLIVVNIANYLLLIGAFVFLFFWKHPDFIEKPDLHLDDEADAVREGDETPASPKV